MNATMKALILDHVHGGHHFTYIRKMTPAIAALADEVIVSVGRASEGTDEFGQQIAPLSSCAIVVPELERPAGSGARYARALAAMVRDAVRRHRPDALYLPTGDHTVQTLGALAFVGRSGVPESAHTEAAMHRVAPAYPTVRKRVPGWLGRALLERSPTDRLQLVDHAAYDYAQAAGGALRRKARLLPDPVDPVERQTKEAARAALGFPTDGRAIGCSGLLDSRKGTPLLLEAFAQAELADDDRLLLCGRASDEVKSLLTGPYAGLVRAGRVLVIDRYITDEELRHSIDACDVVCTPHPAHVGLSNIALRATAAGRPVLGSSFGWIGAMVPRFALGTTCDVRDGGAFARAIADALDRAHDYEETEAIRRLMAFHTEDNFRRAWASGLRERLGLGPDPEELRYDWVLDALP